MSATVRLTVGQAIVRFLAAQYSQFDGDRQRLINGMFGIFGHGNVAGLGQGLEEERGLLRYHQPHNEQAMVHIASGFAKARRRRAVMACTASIGPGTTNMVSGAATATINRLPVLLFASDNYATRHQGPVLQQLEHPLSFDTTAADTLRPVSRFFDRVSRPEQLLVALPAAMRVLTDVRETGAVTIALPQDVQMMAYDWPVQFFNERTWAINRPFPNPDSINAAAELLRSARNPVILAGGGAIYSDAESALGEFARTLGIPVGETHAGLTAGRLAGDLALGGMGVCGTPQAAQIASSADLVIGVGTRYSDFATGSNSLFQNPDVAFLNINVAAHDAYKQGGLAVEADARTALEQLLLAASGYRADPDWTERARRLNQEWRVQLDGEVRPPAAGEGMNQAQVIQALNEHLNPGDFVTVAAGSPPGDIQQQWIADGSGQPLVEFGFSCMGWELPAAVGAKLAAPEANVFTFIGDGTYLMNNTEIVTAAKEGLKIVIVVANNHGFQIIRKLQEAKTGRAFGNEFRTREEGTDRLTGEYAGIDFVKNAESLGAVGMAAADLDELRAALQKADSVVRRPVLIECEVEPSRWAADTGVWWDVAVPEVSRYEDVVAMRSEYEEQRRKQRLYY